MGVLKKFSFPLAAALLGLAIFLAYANHFNNDFHFDDSHTIVGNVYIRNLSNWPLFFTDGRTFSSLPANQMYRPLFTLSTALDYAVAGGLKPFYFHLDSFACFTLQLFFMYWLFLSIFDRACRRAGNKWIALFGVAWYGLHTANAETINYISARSDLLSTLFLVLALVLYIYSPLARRFFLYLIPFALGAFTKPSALMFTPLLFIYIWLFESSGRFSALAPTCTRSLPAVILTGALYLLQKTLTPPTFYPSMIPPFNYLITQPFVSLHYFRTFFLPIGLSADTDWGPLNTIFAPQFFFGLIFIATLLSFAWYCSRQKGMKPIAFGLLWFFIALLPSSSIFALSEVLNDHRIYFPFIGLTLSAVWGAGLLLYKHEEQINSKLILKIMALAFGLCLLLGNALGVRHRNRIWRTEESLWYDVTVKSPKNGRGLMNYGLTQLNKGEYNRALSYFNQALKYTPTYSYLFVNRAITFSALGRSAEAEKDFKKALQLAPNSHVSYFYYARWLNSQGRTNKAIPLLQRAGELSPGFLPSKHLLLEIYAAENNRATADLLAREILLIDPKDPVAQRFFSGSNSPEYYLNISLIYYRQGNYRQCIAAAEEALKLRPDYAEAYNNIGAAYNMMQMWDKGAAACRQALELKPDFTLAKNNLNWAKSRIK
jgi:tetratricopeptide (TPR) repeat protein